jgi:Lar family restriction alleviation protein
MTDAAKPGTGIKLKPCPFCGCEPKFGKYISASVICPGCLIPTVSQGTDDEAVEKWNRRRVDDDHAAAIADLEAKIAKLKSLMLLTDPVVEQVTMNAIATTQYLEYLRVFPEEA